MKRELQLNINYKLCIINEPESKSQRTKWKSMSKFRNKEHKT